MITQADRHPERDGDGNRCGIDPFAGQVPAFRARPANRPPRAPFVCPPPPVSSGPQWAGVAPPEPPRRWSTAVLSVLLVVVLLVAGGAVLLVRTLSAQADGQRVSDGSLVYRVPADWTVVPGAPGTSTDGVTLDGVVTATKFTCNGRRHSRATVGHTFVERRDGAKARTEDAAYDFGPKFAASFYGADATVRASAPTPLTIGYLAGTASLVTVTPKAGAGDCPAPKGTVTVVALPSSRRGTAGGQGVLLLVMQRDTAGGPPAAAMVDERAAASILSSVEVSER